MAVISVNLTDTFEQWRTKTNSLATYQGDLTTLTTTAKNTIVAAINEVDAAASFSNVVEDTSPQLGGNLDVLARIITTSTTNGNIAITPHGSGKVVLDGISHPNADGTNGQVLQTNGSGVLSFATISSDPTMGGDLSGTASNAQIVANSVTTTELANAAVHNTNIADNVISTGKILNGTLLNDDISNSAGITGGKLANATITGTQIANDAIDSQHYAADSIDAEHYAPGSVDTTALADNAITNAKLNNGEITLNKMGAGGTASTTTFLRGDFSWQAPPVSLTADQSWTGSQRATMVTDNDGSFDMNAGQNFNCTPSGNFTLTFTNIANGQSGFIILINPNGRTVSLHANSKADASLAGTVSAAGTYILSYISNGTNVYLTNSAVMA